MASLAMATLTTFNFRGIPSPNISHALISQGNHQCAYVGGVFVTIKSSGAHIIQPIPVRRFVIPHVIGPHTEEEALATAFEDVGKLHAVEIMAGFLFSHEGDFKHLSWPLHAVGSGLEASIRDSEQNDIILKNVTIVVESRDDEKIHVRVDLTGEQTQRTFDDVLKNLAITAPPLPGFRRTKGGRTPNVPKSFLLQVLGEDRVTKFTIQEIVSTSIAEYVKKENLKVKSKFSTTQTEEELLSVFSPGNAFGFNATMEIEISETEPDISGSSDDEV